MYQQDREWETSYQSQVLKKLRALLPYLADVEVASDETDKKCATDFEVRIQGGSIAVRLRRPYQNYRDLTIRSRRKNGVKTELAKIKEGYAFRYFYAWIDTNNTLAEWMLIDLDKVRSAGLLENRVEKPNKDGETYFIWIPARELDEAGCLIAGLLKQGTLKVQQPPTFPFQHNMVQPYLNKKYNLWTRGEV